MAPLTIEVYRIDTDKITGDTSKYEQPLVDAMKAVPGSHKGYHGNEVQDNKQLYFVQAWDSVEKHKELVAKSAAWKEFKEHVSAISSHQYSLHGLYDRDPTPALTAPVTELLYLIANKNVSRDEVLKPLFASLVDIVRSTPGVTAAAWGPVVEDDKRFGMIAGWQSMEHFASSVKNSEAAQALLGQIKEVATVELRHALLSPYKA